MDTTCQIEIPPSFIALYLKSPSFQIPAHRFPQIFERYEFCEDLAQGLSDKGHIFIIELGITAQNVLSRFYEQLGTIPVQLSESEKAWVMTRCQEISTWCHEG